jgi:hypothetical protein
MSFIMDPIKIEMIIMQLTRYKEGCSARDGQPVLGQTPENECSIQSVDGINFLTKGKFVLMDGRQICRFDRQVMVVLLPKS